jgi:DNA-binding transcriptional MocR family regulator
MAKFEYVRLADTVAAEIANGEFKPGDRLPPQRSFAYQRKIAVSTASRVYTELLRRGLVVGEVGRGTFISGEARRGATAPTEPRGARIDLEINYPMLPAQPALIAKSLEGLDRPEMLEVALRQGTSAGTQATRNIAANFLARQNWAPRPEQMLFTANGRQSIAAALAALVPPGGRCGVEALTYPFIKGIAARLGVTLVPLAMDEHGVRPDAVQKAHRDAHLSALYIQPTIQNPLGMTMPNARRADLLRVVEKLDLPVIEDTVYGFLADEPPLAVLAPERCVVIDSLSKKVAPGPGAGLHRRAAALARKHHGLDSLRRLDGIGICIRSRAADHGRRHRIRTRETETHRRAATSATGGRAPRRFQVPGQQQIVSSLADAAAAMALANLCRRGGTAGHRPDAVHDLRRQPRTCTERDTARFGGAHDRATRCRAAHPVGNAERDRRRFRFDRIDGKPARPPSPLHGTGHSAMKFIAL